MASSETLLVLSTCGQLDEAEGLAEALVAGRLAACVNLVPAMRSVYRWEGDVERAEEVLLLIKTTRDRLGAVEAAIRSRSSYELPEVVAIPVAGGSAEYLEWIGASVAT